MAQQERNAPAELDATDGLCCTLIAMGQPDDLDRAEELLAAAKTLLADTLLQQQQTKRQAVVPLVQCGLADDFVQLALRRRDYAAAREAIKRFARVIEDVPLPDHLCRRFRIHARFLQAQVDYEDPPEGDEYCQRAQQGFLAVKAEAEATKWRRAVFYAAHYLADIAIETGDLPRARALLDEGLPRVQEEKYAAGLAYYFRSYTRLEHKEGEFARAHAWAEQALAAFNLLEMTPEAQEMSRFLDEGKWPAERSKTVLTL